MRGGRILRRIALVGVALLLCALGTEVGVGLLDPYGVLDALHGERYRAELIELLPGSPRLFRHYPNREVRLRGWVIRTNGDGLRGPDRAKPKPADVRRIVFVGDSVVFGWGVDAEDTFVHLVEGQLDRRGGFRWECVNLGHQFHDTTQEAAAFEEVGLSYEPDLVLLVFVDNDVVLTRDVFAGKGGTPTEGARRAQRGLERLATIRPLLPRTHALLLCALGTEVGVGLLDPYGVL
ncbi:MAG TPA: SGNH/GDSL hydrolase family protein, partial [Planctomycetota bacterium]|nr:SGNH/GDSL hydrolase family protein [Planctomycetota bacterium]